MKLKKVSNNRSEFDSKPPWYYSGPCIFAVFQSISLTIGIIVVCITLRNNTKTTCQFNFKQTNTQHIGYNSSSYYIIVGDLNNDNNPDLIVANSGMDSIGIFFGYENGTFADQITYSTGLDSDPYSVAIGDFNKDNHLDIVVANYGTNNIGLFLSYGNGTFASQKTFSMNSSRPMIILVEDMNKDNQLDIIVTNNGTLTVDILLGYPDGSFQLETTLNMGYDSNPYTFVVKDFNKDTNMDIGIVNYGTDNLVILLSNGNGSFTKYLYSTGSGSYPRAITAGYFNNDNVIDLVITNNHADNIGIFLGNENGTFQNMITYSTGVDSTPENVAIGDFNNDSLTDIAVVNVGSSNIMIFKGHGNGTFSKIVTYSTGSNSYPFGIVVNDFDKDNLSDIAITDVAGGTILVLTLYGIYPTAKQTTYILQEGSQPFSLAIDDFNNDKNLDIVVANAFTENIVIFIGNGDGTFKIQDIYYMPNNSDTYFVSTGDVNNDNRSDIVVLLQGISTVQILLGYGNGSFRFAKTFVLQANILPYSIAVADFNDDNILDFVTSNYQAGSAGLFLGRSNGTFINAGVLLSGYDIYPKCVDVGDFNNDNITDIITSDSSNGLTIITLLGYGNGSFQDPIWSFTSVDSVNCFLLTDLNRDNKIDIIYISTSFSEINVLFGYGNGSFGNLISRTIPSGTNLWFVILDNLSNNDWSGLNVGNAYDNNIGSFLSVNNGNFASKTRFFTSAGSIPYTLAFGDFNNDGQLDTILGNAEYNNIQVYILKFASTFASETSYYTGSGPHPHSIFVADINNDSKQEIIVAESVTNDIQILFDYSEQIFLQTTTYSTGFGSHPQYVTVADFNHDNQLDIAAANSWTDNIYVFLGLGNGLFNTPSAHSTGFGSSPASIAVGDFNRDGWTDMIVANENEDNVGVFLGFEYATFTNQSFFINGVLPKPYHIAVGDFNNDFHKDIVVVISALNSITILLGYGNGTFGKQISFQTGLSSNPVFVAVGDFNNDNQTDIVVANHDTNNISIFLGYGNGSFNNPNLPELNEIYYPVSIALGDFNNDNCLDMVVANKYADTISIILGHGNGSFDIPRFHFLSQGSIPTCVIVTDFNNDYILDIAVANYNGNNINILLGYGNGTFEDKDILSTGTNSSPYSIASGDLNNDNWTDIVVINQQGQNIGIFFGYGDGEFSLQKTISTGSLSYLSSILIGKLNDDAFLDIATTDWSTGNTHIDIHYGFGDGTFTIAKTAKLNFNSKPTAIIMADFNSDNLNDLAICNSNRHSVFIMLRDSSEPFAAQTNYYTGNNSRPRSVTVVDLNNDNILDIIVANSGTDNIGIFLGYGNGSFESQEMYPVNNNSIPVFVTTGDIDNDSRIDIIVVNSIANNFNIFFGYINRTFASLRTYSTGDSSNPSAIAIADLNKDQYLDIIVSNYGINNVLIFLGFGNGSFLDAKVYPMSYNANPQSIAIGDFNNDSLMDIAVANYGADFTEILEQTC